MVVGGWWLVRGGFSCFSLCVCVLCVSFWSLFVFLFLCCSFVVVVGFLRVKGGCGYGWALNPYRLIFVSVLDCLLYIFK